MPLEINSLLYNRYRIDGVIAQGGMGAIYQATDQSLGVQVAVKENLFTSEESSRQFRREATMLAGLRQPNLPRVTDHFVIPNQGQYLVMDYIDGDDLRQRLQKDKKIPEGQVLLIGETICDALTYLHSRQPPIIHRDIKPGNIKISSSGQIYLVDFGLAKLSQPGQATTIGAQALTPGYSPPEQYGKGTETHSDIYSLGATLYAGLTGKIPEDGLARAMGTSQLTPVRTANPEISERTAMVIEKAMSVAPENRYRSAEDFKQALISCQNITTQKIAQKYQIGQQAQVATIASTGNAAPTIKGSQKPPAGSSSSVSPEKKRGPNLIPLILLGVFAVLAIIITAGYFIFKNVTADQIALVNPDIPTAIKNTPFIIKTKPQATNTVIKETNTPQSLPTATEIPATPEPTLTFTPAATPIGGGTGQIAYASQQGSAPQIWLMNSDGTEQLQLTHIPDGACQPAWSPDGKRLVFTSPCPGKQDIYKGSGLFLINADGSGQTPLHSVPGGDFDPSWSPDGTKIAFTSIREIIPHIFTYDLTTNTVQRLSNQSSNDRRPYWSPDGKWIVYESSRLGVSQIWIMDQNGGSVREFSPMQSGASFMPAWSPDGSFIVYIHGTYQPWLVGRPYSTNLTPETVVNDKLRGVYDPGYSTDSFWLVFEYVNNGKSDIYRMMLNGGNLTPLTSNTGSNFNPSWQPVPVD
jgi:serine/threonine protein kinase